MKIDYLCPNFQCEHEIELDYTPIGEGQSAKINPGECPHCGMDIDPKEIANQ